MLSEVYESYVTSRQNRHIELLRILKTRLSHVTFVSAYDLNVRLHLPMRDWRSQSERYRAVIDQ